MDYEYETELPLNSQDSELEPLTVVSYQELLDDIQDAA